MLKIIGYLVGSLLILLVVLLFIKIKVKIIWNEVDHFVQIRYLFLKFNYDLKEKVDLITEKAEETVVEFAQATKENLKSDEPLDDIDLNANVKSYHVDSAQIEKLKKKKVRIDEPEITSKESQQSKKRQKQKKKVIENIEEIKGKEKRKAFFIRVKQIRIYIQKGRRLIYRLIGRIHVHKLVTSLKFNVEDPMLNGYLYGGLWTVSGHLFHYITSHVKEVDELDYDIQTQFSGNNIFVTLECIVSITLADIILVLLLSLKDLLIIRKTYKLKEELY